MKRYLVALLIAAAGSSGVGSSQSAPGMFTRLDPVVDALWSGFDTGQAQQHVEFISKFWRLAGNAGYDASLDRVRARLQSAGYSGSRLFFDQYPNTESGGWDHTVGTLAIAGSSRASDEVVLSREKERLALCINSFSTPPEGVLAPLVDVGRGDRDEDYAGKDVKGAVVLGDADTGQLWRRAVTNGGAIGVVSTSLPKYISPDPPSAKPTPRDQWDILQWGSIPYDAVRKGFGFKASPRAAARLRRARPRGSFSDEQAKKTPEVVVRVTINSSFSTKPNRTLIAEILGRVAPAERVILASHVQEPGANDNASGVATLAELAAALEARIRAGKIAPPARTLTFLFLNEIGGSRRWLQDHAEDAKRVRYMISMDMTGEDVAKTGGSFLVERWPDPGAVWDRPWDPHSEWGRGNVRADQLKGDLINDAHLAVCERVARKTGWVVKSNPYEGGSDHTVFGSAGVPSLLDWHFTDRYYHTNFDTPDKTSPAEMRNVGVCAAATAWLLGSADAALSLSVAELVASAGKTRIALEEREGAKLAAAEKDPVAAKTREGQIVAAWRKWYAEAVRSASRLVVGPVPPDFSSRLETLVRSADWFPRPRVSLEPAAEEPAESLADDTIVPLEAPDQSPQSNREPPADTRLLVCGTDMLLPVLIPLRWDTVVLAGDSRGYSPCRGQHTEQHREWREATVISMAITNRDPALRRLAVLAIGRMGESASVPRLSRLLADPDEGVRRAAAPAIAEALAGRSGELRPADKLDPKFFAEGRAALVARLRVETDDDVAGAILATLGRLRFPNDATRDEVESLLVAAANEKARPARILGVTKGLEALIRGNPKRPAGAKTREKLRQLAVSGPTLSPVSTVGGEGTAPASGDADNLARSRRLALMALQLARDDDVETLRRAATDGDWQVRRLVALRLDAERVELQPIIDLLSIDKAFQVRYEMLNVFARAAVRTRDCTPVLRYFQDPEPTVGLRAIDAIPPVCGEHEVAIKELVKWAEELKTPLGPQSWHVPAHALEALARLKPEAGRPLLGAAADHQIWQVRARAAAACEAFKDGDVARRLAGDREPNVRTAALETLIRLQDPARFAAGVDALKQDDYQLLRTAALALRGVPEPERNATANELLNALRRLTGALSDTSRDPRVAILERLGEILPVDRTAELGAYRQDFDPKIREAATSALAKVTQTKPEESVSGIKHRYPYQPVQEMARLPKGAVISMEGGGTIHLEMLVNEAPVTVARFSELARAGYYNGLTFHRVVPNFVIQGGSPGANEYAGVSRYMRDEIGIEPHSRGAVGISTRGPDTGDAQIFIDLVDIPRLDHQYTVFARVVAGLDVVERILEGAKIQSITLK
ncbi:MAG TPA: peptidylprolyl isomerase [Vicinamibacterales bacterium]|nr:peptidylprolyl isomerase [Vicinamibacterales bacterium]